MKRNLLNLFILLIPIWSFGQSCGALMVPISIEDRVNESTQIVEGVITSSQSYWDISKHNIYTLHTVSVYADMLGNSASSVQFVTMGGQVGDAMQITSSEASLEVGVIATFFLKESAVKLSGKSTMYELVGAAQGVIKYSKRSDSASDVFNKYQSITKELYPKIQRVTAKRFRTLQKRPTVADRTTTNAKALLATPAISNFSPTSASAGTQTVLTINGSNFGTVAGTVSFPNANAGGLSYTDALSSEIISWSDTQIQVQVPSLAGTGAIQVTNSTAETGTSNANLTVTYSHLNATFSAEAFPTALQDDDGNGGFTFQYHTDFDTSSAKSYFEEAFALWNCESNINFVFGSTTTTDVSVDDGVNIVRFDNGSELPINVLGRVTTRFLGSCPTTNRMVVKELDVTWNDDINWYYGSGTPSATQYDFKSVALHELGHAHQLGHVIDPGLVMHYSLGSGDVSYALNQNDIDGATYTMGLFTESVGCSSIPMTEQINCCDDIVINSQPTDSSTEVDGDAQFVVDASNFTQVNWLVSVSGSSLFSTVSDNALFSGSNTATLSLQNVPLSYDGYRFRAVLQNECGTETPTNIATLNVLEYTAIPDANFEAALSAYDDIPGDGQVPTANIEMLTNLNVSDANISDLTGLEDFVQLTALDISENNLTTVSLSTLTNLEVFEADANFNLTSVDLSGNTALREISLEDCTALTTLNLSTNTSLEILSASQSGLASITLGNLPNLTSVDLGFTNVTTLDFSAATSLVILNVPNCQLTSLNVTNGNNTIITNFVTLNNPNLFCIAVDDVAFAEANFTNIDAQTSFSDTNCYTTISDANFETALHNLGYDDILGDGQVPTALIAGVTTLDVDNTGITDLTGIADFTSLVNLDIDDNNINTVDLSNNKQLQVLVAKDANIQNLNLDGLTNLYQISLQFNVITSLDLSTNTAIRSMNISLNELTYVNLQNGNNSIITDLDARSNDNLECILVDDVNIVNTASIYTDSQTNLSQYCTYTAIPDANFETALENLGYDDISGDGQVPTALIETVTSLFVGNANISDLTGIEDFTALETLAAFQNNLTTLDLSNNLALTFLSAPDNNISSLDLGTNTSYETIFIRENNLSEIDVTGFTSLEWLDLKNNPITALDVSSNLDLAQLQCEGCNLFSLNMKNGNNTNISNFDIGLNPNLTCVLVDDAAYSTANWTSVDVQTVFNDVECAAISYIAIPDANFETALGNLGYDDISGDGQIPTTTIETLTSLDVSNASIANLTGIEAFVDLESLIVNDNTISSINLGSNTKIKILNARNNGLTSLDISTCTDMDLLLLENNSLTSLDLSKNTQLTRIWAQNNNFNSFDVTNNPLLRAIGISNSNLTSLDLTKNIALQQLYAAGNSITEVDLSNSPAMRIVSLHTNNLSSFNIQNGNNANITAFELANNSSLTCVQVDDAAYSTTNWTDVDAQTNFSETAYCEYTAIPGASFEGTLEFLGYDDIPGDGRVPTALIKGITTLSIAGMDISDLTGIEDFTALEYLQCSDNTLTSLDISSNTALERLYCNRNSLTDLELGFNTVLTSLNCEDNNLSTLNLLDSPALEDILISNNPITSLDFINNWALISITAKSTNVIDVDLTMLPSLEEVVFSGNNISSFNLKNNNNGNIDKFEVSNTPSLSCISVDDASYATTNWTSVDAHVSFSETSYCQYTSVPDSNFETALENFGYDDISGDGQVPTALISGVTDLNLLGATVTDLTGIADFDSLTRLQISGNNISTVDLSNNSQLETLTAVDCNIQTLNVTGLTNLNFLLVEVNQLTSLDLSTTPAVSSIDLRDNNLTELNLQNGNNTTITSFDIRSNPDLSCVQVDDAAYSTANWINVDAQTNFSETQYCEYTAIPDANFEATLGYLGYDDISGDGQVPTALIEGVTTLSVINMEISDLTGIEDFTALEELNVDTNFLSDLDLSANTNLIKIECGSNSMDSINLNGLTALEEFDGGSNDYTTLDFSTNTSLTKLYCDSNDLTALDVSNNTILTDLDCSNNALTTLNVRNGNNTNVTNFNATNNPNLDCIQVDDVTYSTTNWTNVDAQTNFSETAYCEYTAIPDANFETALANLGYDDISGDGQVPTELIKTVASLSVSSANISDLTGIEDFTALRQFFVSRNNLTTLDLSNNPLISNLGAKNNNISTLNLGTNTNYQLIDLSNNNLTSFDASNFTGLALLELNNNPITSMDLSANIELGNFECSGCDLSSLNIQNGNYLHISTFKVRNNPNLTCVLVDDVAYSTANWTNIDAQTSFSETYCLYTQIPDANFEAALDALGYDDISSDGQVPTALIEVVTSLNLFNSNIADLTGIEDFRALELLNLTNNNLTSLDVSTNTNLEVLNCENNSLTALDVTANVLLETLVASGNALGNIDVSTNTYLEILLLNTCGLSSIDLSNNKLLSLVGLSNNQLTTLDFTVNTSLEDLYVDNNELAFLNFKNGDNTNIKAFNATNNSELECILVDDATYSTTYWTNIDAQTSFSDTYCRYTTIPDANFEAALEALGYDDISGDGQVPTALIETVGFLSVSNANIADLTGIEAFVALGELVLTGNNLTALDLSNNTSLGLLSAADNNISTFNLGTNTNYEAIVLSNNNLTAFDASNLSVLSSLQLNNNPITVLDLSASTALQTFQCSNCDLSSLNVQNGNNTDMVTFDILGNPNLTCVIVDDAAYSTTNWTNIDVQTTFSETSCITDYAVAIKAYVQGAALNPNEGEESLLRDDLRVAGLIPTTSPYTDALTCDATVFDSTGNDAIVDWVWVELRDQNDVTVVIAGQSALLQRDGDIVAVDGVSDVAFSIEADDYYVLITHRNHLGIRSANTVSLSATTAILDLTTDTSLILGGTNAVTEIRNGTYAMLAGDGDANGQIQNTDINTVITLLGGSGYSDADMDMNGQVQNTDINNLMNPNVGKGEQF
ncbi:matrixin family metalloprotease [Aquimarina sp. MMG016]|uniref:matrixin family metalloprotease n=1 Tax=Aquimarina sp. MMG016 TaxID=2822690 RepID=UPI001B3A0189|nr:matrixin family metalloprotease [Aquimarina sp. MMG016]MBQ4820917.1 matrixin family metalloprotease [Aquimarina sp. MMG016]